MTTKRFEIRARAALLKIRATIKKGWCQGAFAYDKDNNCVGANSSKAIKWCLVGACNKIMRQGDFSNEVQNLLFDTTMNPVSLSVWNDDRMRKKKQVLDLIDKTISILDE